MEKLKQSEEEIIKLGKKIVKELQLEERGNTLGRWMSHYVGELIQQAENYKSTSDKRAKQKECFEVILKLWGNRKHLPNVSTPLGELEPLIKLLDVFIEDEHALSFFRGYRDMPNDGSWVELINTVKTSSKNIFRLSLLSQVNSELLAKKQEWLVEHKSMLDKEEKEMLEKLEYFVNRGNAFVNITFTHEEEEKVNFDKLSPKRRYEAIFNKLESEMDDQKAALLKLKDKILST